MVVQWGSQLPSAFNLEISFTAVSWDPLVVQQLPTNGAQQLEVSGVAQWLRVYCSGGCSIQELQVATFLKKTLADQTEKKKLENGKILKILNVFLGETEVSNIYDFKICRKGRWKKLLNARSMAPAAGWRVHRSWCKRLGPFAVSVGHPARVDSR